MKKQFICLITALLTVIVATDTASTYADTTSPEGTDSIMKPIDKASFVIPKMIPTGAIKMIRKDGSF